jgi:spermidine/putrescine ABC transporter ATP-binding subunit
MLLDSYTGTMTGLEVDSINKRFGATQVLRGVSLSITEGELFFILGASGCGKSTLLRIIAGLETPDSGRIFLDGDDVTTLPAHKRGIGMVFQQYALWPHMTVAQNVSLGLEIRRIPTAERKKRVDESLEIVRMTGLGDRYPHEISGGQQQRVALARALAIQPKILLLDEPLSNLDARLRDEIREELKAIHQELKLTMIYVTHDQEDALTLASRIALLREGRVEQVGPPRELYERPRTQYAAEFLGQANIIPCTVVKQSSSASLEIRLPGITDRSFVCVGNAPAREGDSSLCIRPEMLRVSTEQPHDSNLIALSGSVTRTTYRGSWVDVECKLFNGLAVTARESTADAHTIPPVGSSVVLTCKPASITVVA